MDAEVTLQILKTEYHIKRVTYLLERGNFCFLVEEKLAKQLLKIFQRRLEELKKIAPVDGARTGC